MKIIKMILFFVFIPSFFIPLKAQTDTGGPKKMCDGLMRATYIFEGKLDSSKYFTIKTGEYTYENFNAYLVEVTKVIKGDIQKGTIEILQHAAGYTYKGPDHWEGGGRSAEPEATPPGQGIYFCWGKDNYMKYSYYINSNGKDIRYFDGITLINGELPKDPRCCGPSFYFSTFSGFCNYISANYGIKIEQ